MGTFLNIDPFLSPESCLSLMTVLVPGVLTIIGHDDWWRAERALLQTSIIDDPLSSISPLSRPLSVCSCSQLFSLVISPDTSLTKTAFIHPVMTVARCGGETMSKCISVASATLTCVKTGEEVSSGDWDTL